MALSDVDALKLHLKIASTNTTEDDFLAQLLAGVEAAFLKLVDRRIERETITEFQGGRNSRVLMLNEYPVHFYQYSGTTTTSSAVVTALSSTASLAVGMPVTGTGIPAGATISTVDSATQVTLSTAATATGTVTLTFGLAVYYDATGAWGTSSDAFASATLLTPYTDYAPVRDGVNGLCDSGRLVRINGVWPGRWEYAQGNLTPLPKPSLGTVKIVYTCGFVPVPADIELCLWQACAELRAMRTGGLMLSSENFDGYGYSLIERDAKQQLMLPGSRQQVVARYRRKTPRHTVLG